MVCIYFKFRISNDYPTILEFVSIMQTKNWEPGQHLIGPYTHFYILRFARWLFSRASLDQSDASSQFFDCLTLEHHSRLMFSLLFIKKCKIISILLFREIHILNILLYYNSLIICSNSKGSTKVRTHGVHANVAIVKCVEVE